MARRRTQRDLDQAGAQQVLVESAADFCPRFVLRKRLRDETRLLEHPLRAAIARDLSADRLLDQLAETLDCLRLTAKLVVELDHLGDQTWPDPKRQIGRRLCRMNGGCLRDRFALVGRQAAGTANTGMQLVVELVAAQEQHPGRPPRQVSCELAGSGPIRNDDDCPRPIGNVADDAAEGVQIGNADKARPAGSDHFVSRGPWNRLLNSLRACASSISAPAAADDASHARRRSPVRVASILTLAAVSAR